MSHVLLMTYYLFGLVLNFTIQIIEAEFIVGLFIVVAIVVFKTVVPRFQKTRTDIHDTTRLRAGCSIR